MYWLPSASWNIDHKSEIEQEYIPVGCVFPAAVAIGGVCLSACWDRHPLVWAWRPPCQDPPQLPPWVWAWRPPSGQTPLNFALGCGPGDTAGEIPLNIHPGCGPGNMQGLLWYDPPPDLFKGILGYHLAMHAGMLPLPVNRILDTRLWKYYLAPTSLRVVRPNIAYTCNSSYWYSIINGHGVINICLAPEVRIPHLNSTCHNVMDMQVGIRLTRSHFSARFCFELSGNLN